MLVRAVLPEASTHTSRVKPVRWPKELGAGERNWVHVFPENLRYVFLRFIQLKSLIIFK